MSPRASIAILAGAALVAGAALAAGPGDEAGPASVEKLAVESLTISDHQFLLGEAEGKRVTLSGELHLVDSKHRQPVVVLMHGSGGLSPNEPIWARQFAELGVGAFILDGFGGRGLTSTVTDQAQLGRLNFILDLYRSLDMLAKNPRVDPSRIAVMGFSRGGQAALYASLERFNLLWNRSGAQFAAYIPLYPDCAMRFIGDDRVQPRPIRILHGADDDYDPPASCRAYVERLRAARRDVTITLYPRSAHGFDSPSGGQVVEVPQAQTLRNCHIIETKPGLLVDEATGAPFSYASPCVERGTHVGGNPEAAQQARRDVADFLVETFRLAKER